MPIQAPSADQVIEIAASYGMDLSVADVDSFTDLLSGITLSYNRLDVMVEPKRR